VSAPEPDITEQAVTEPAITGTDIADPGITDSAVTDSAVTRTDIAVTVNGTCAAYPLGTTVAAVVARVCATTNGVAVAVGDAVVPRAEWGGRTLCDGDEVEILTAVQGG
jgi:sulfur carrier protein